MKAYTLREQQLQKMAERLLSNEIVEHEGRRAERSVVVSCSEDRNVAVAVWTMMKKLEPVSPFTQPAALHDGLKDYDPAQEPIGLFQVDNLGAAALFMLTGETP